MPPDNQTETDPLVEELQAEVGDDLRTVTIYGEKSYEMLYIRENIEAIYSTADLDVIFDEIRMEGWGRQRPKTCSMLAGWIATSTASARQ